MSDVIPTTSTSPPPPPPPPSSLSPTAIPSMSSNLCHQLMGRERTGTPLLHYQTASFAAHLYRERMRLARNLYKSDLRGHFGCVNAIEFAHGGQYLASGGDDKRVLIWNVEQAIAGIGRPRALHTEHTSNIFCLGFDGGNRRVYSGGNDDLVIAHDFETGKLLTVFKHDNPVYGLSIDPQYDDIFATAGEDGQLLVYDQRRDPNDEPFVLAQLRTSFHAVEFHPSAGGHLLVSANSKRGAALWDLRKPHEPVIQYGHVAEPPSCMSVRFNAQGTLILALRRRLPPILYGTQSPEPICTFYHSNYYNSCTMKSCTFAGMDDELVLSGSDDFNLYVWRVSDVDFELTDQWVETTQMVLYGHRSIVNQVRYNREKCLLASSGVEKIVKLWSPFAQRGWSGALMEPANCSDNPRELYSPYNLASSMSAVVGLVQGGGGGTTPPHEPAVGVGIGGGGAGATSGWGAMSHDYSGRNTLEDPRMMAFFDSLIQQEIEGWETNSSSSEGEPGAGGVTAGTAAEADVPFDAVAENVAAGVETSSSYASSSSTGSSSSSSSSSSDSEASLNGRSVRSDVVVPPRRGYYAAAQAKVRQLRRSRHIAGNAQHTHERRRRRSRSHASDAPPSQRPVKLQRHKFANRIAYLIATKRNRLRRLALKSAALHNRRVCRVQKRQAPSTSTTAVPSTGAATTPGAVATKEGQSNAANSLRHKRPHNDGGTHPPLCLAASTSAAAAAAVRLPDAAMTINNATQHRNTTRPRHKRCKRLRSSFAADATVSTTAASSIASSAPPSTTETSDVHDEDDNEEAATSSTMTASAASTSVITTLKPTAKSTRARRPQLRRYLDSDNDDDDGYGDDGSANNNGLAVEEPAHLHSADEEPTRGRNETVHHAVDAAVNEEDEYLYDVLPVEREEQAEEQQYEVLLSAVAAAAAAATTTTTMLPQKNQRNGAGRPNANGCGLKHNNTSNNNNIGANNKRNSSRRRSSDNAAPPAEQHPLEQREWLATATLEEDEPLPSTDPAAQQQNQRTPLKRRKVMNNNNSSETSAAVTANNNNNYNNLLFTPDSGISLSSSSGSNSNSHSNNHSNNNNNNSNFFSIDEWTLMSPAAVQRDTSNSTAPTTATGLTVFQQRVANVRRNYRKRFTVVDNNAAGDDGDADEGDVNGPTTTTSNNIL